MEVDEPYSPEEGKGRREKKNRKKTSKEAPKRQGTGILIKKSTMIIQNLRDLEDEYDIGEKLGSGSYGIVKN